MNWFLAKTVENPLDLATKWLKRHHWLARSRPRAGGAREGGTRSAARVASSARRRRRRPRRALHPAGGAREGGAREPLQV